MAKKLTVFLLAVFALGLVGCSKDAQIKSFLTEWENVTKDMSAKIEAGDIDGAKAAFDAKKDSLKKNLEEIKNSKGRTSEETKKKMEESAKKNKSNLLSATMKGIMKISGDKAKSDKLQALMEEYSDIFKM